MLKQRRVESLRMWTLERRVGERGKEERDKKESLKRNKKKELEASD